MLRCSQEASVVGMEWARVSTAEEAQRQCGFTDENVGPFWSLEGPLAHILSENKASEGNWTGETHLAHILKGRITVATIVAGCCQVRDYITVTHRTIATIPGSSTCLPPAHGGRALPVLSWQTLFTLMEEQERLCPDTGFKDLLKTGQNIWSSGCEKPGHQAREDQQWSLGAEIWKRRAVQLPQLAVYTDCPGHVQPAPWVWRGNHRAESVGAGRWQTREERAAEGGENPAHGQRGCWSHSRNSSFRWHHIQDSEGSCLKLQPIKP